MIKSCLLILYTEDKYRAVAKYSFISIYYFFIKTQYPKDCPNIWLMPLLVGINMAYGFWPKAFGLGFG